MRYLRFDHPVLFQGLDRYGAPIGEEGRHASRLRFVPRVQGH